MPALANQSSDDEIVVTMRDRDGSMVDKSKEFISITEARANERFTNRSKSKDAAAADVGSIEDDQGTATGI